MAFHPTMELEDLQDRQRELQQRANEFFNGDDNPHDGDRGYQDLLEQISDIAEQISDIEEGFDNDVENQIPIEDQENIVADANFYDNDEDFDMDIPYNDTDVTFDDLR
jgi:hypothetical protein